jgi:hypothetical protein
MMISFKHPTFVPLFYSFVDKLVFREFSISLLDTDVNEA